MSAAGTRPGFFATLTVGVVLIVTTALLLLALVILWPRTMPNVGNGQSPKTPAAPERLELFGRDLGVTVQPEPRLLGLVMLAGALGAIMHALRSFYWYVGQRALRWSWIPMYFVLPWVGAALGVVVYVGLRGGLFSAQSSASDASTLGFVAVAGLAGLFTRETMEKLKKIAEATFEKAAAGNDTAATQHPFITFVMPTPLRQSSTPEIVAVYGRAFRNTMKVFANSAPLDTTFVSDTQLTATIPIALQTPGTNLAITVGVPGDPTTVSNRLTLPVT